MVRVYTGEHHHEYMLPGDAADIEYDCPKCGFDRGNHEVSKRNRLIPCESDGEGDDDKEEEACNECEEEEVRCVCELCGGEGWCYVSKQRATELKKKGLMEQNCPFGDKCSYESDSDEEEEEDYKNYGVLAIGYKDEQEDIGFFYTIEEAIVEYKKVSLIDYMRVVIFESENYNPAEGGEFIIVKSRTKKVKKQIKLKLKK